VIGLDGRGVDCKTSVNSKLESILKWAHYAGKSTGIVTTTRITHATPAGAYASVPSREMEAYDGRNFNANSQQDGCKDIAAQLIDDNSYINVKFFISLLFFILFN
jgi:alkaline phosphatase